MTPWAASLFSGPQPVQCLTVGGWHGTLGRITSRRVQRTSSDASANLPPPHLPTTTNTPLLPLHSAFGSLSPAQGTVCCGICQSTAMPRRTSAKAKRKKELRMKKAQAEAEKKAVVNAAMFNEDGSVVRDC